MINTHTLHYVKPLLNPSISFMLTGPLYPEASFRKEVLNKTLQPLSNLRKKEIGDMVLSKYLKIRHLIFQLI
jgi:hypothetical protein